MHHKIIKYFKGKTLSVKIITSLISLLLCGAWISGSIETGRAPLDPIQHVHDNNPASMGTSSIEHAFDQRHPEVEKSVPPFEGTVIDDLSEQFSRQGPERYWHEADQGYEGHCWWTKNNRASIENKARWNLGIIQAGTYEISIHIPPAHATTQHAVYIVSHSGEQDRVTVNQNAYRNSWYKLGDFPFAGSGDEYIELIDETGEADAQYEIAFDAVSYLPLDPSWEDKISGALWDRIRPWLDEKTAILEEAFKEWLNDQKGKLLQKMADTLKNWIDQQCAGLGAAMLFPLVALILWYKKREKPETK